MGARPIRRFGPRWGWLLAAGLVFGALVLFDTQALLQLSWMGLCQLVSPRYRWPALLLAVAGVIACTRPRKPVAKRPAGKRAASSGKATGKAARSKPRAGTAAGRRPRVARAARTPR